MDNVRDLIDIDYIGNILKTSQFKGWSIYQRGVRFSIWVSESDVEKLKRVMRKHHYVLLEEKCGKYRDRCKSKRKKTLWVSECILRQSSIVRPRSSVVEVS